MSAAVQSGMAQRRLKAAPAIVLGVSAFPAAFFDVRRWPRSTCHEAFPL